MDMGGALDDAAGELLLGLPWLLLALVAWQSSRGRLAVGPRAEPAGVMAPAPPVEPAQVLDHPGAGELVPPHSVVATPSPGPDREGVLLSAIEAAKAADDDLVFSSLSVELARLLIARSASQQAAQHLQSAALAARRSNLPQAHAAARIELAELAYRDGDLTSACEHWQMAKLMFHETGRRFDRDRIAEVMRQHRCPTDWVLTNF